MQAIPLLLTVLLPAAGPPDRASVPGPLKADVVIRNVRIVDGTGGPVRVGDVALAGDRVVGVGHFLVAGAPRVIDGTGLVAAPGFIDLHTHSDGPLTQPATRANLCYLRQGVTTVVTGNCGAGPADVAAYLRSLEAGQVGSNVLHQVPHNAVRQQVMGNANRPPTEAELGRMKALVERGMKDGAWGLSTGLIYNPGTYSKTDELVALAAVAARHGGFYASHIRDEGVGVPTAVEEALTVGRKANLPVHISHIKASGRKAWGLSGDVVAYIEAARKAGQVVTADQYPYVASSTSLAAALIPARFREGERKAFLARLRDPEQRALIRKAVEQALTGDRADRLRIARYAPRPAWQGQDLGAIAREEKKEPADLVLDIELGGGAQIVNFGMNEEDLRLFMKQPWVATASDGASLVPSATVPHPRSYGTFARKVGRYALVEGVVSLEQAVRSASGLPADILRLSDRGYLKAGQAADVVVFDPETFRDTATYDKPHQYAIGVRYLFVNGVPAIEAGKATGKLAGRVLRHPGVRPPGAE